MTNIIITNKENSLKTTFYANMIKFILDSKFNCTYNNFSLYINAAHNIGDDNIISKHDILLDICYQLYSIPVDQVITIGTAIDSYWYNYNDNTFYNRTDKMLYGLVEGKLYDINNKNIVIKLNDLLNQTEAKLKEINHNIIVNIIINKLVNRVKDTIVKDIQPWELEAIGNAIPSLYGGCFVMDMPIELNISGVSVYNIDTTEAHSTAFYKIYKILKKLKQNEVNRT